MYFSGHRELNSIHIDCLAREGHILSDFIKSQKTKKEAIMILQKELEVGEYHIKLRLFMANVDKLPKVLRLYRQGLLTVSDVRYLGCCSKEKQKLLLKKKKRKCPSAANASISNLGNIVVEMNKMAAVYCKHHNLPLVEYQTPKEMTKLPRLKAGRKKGISTQDLRPNVIRKDYYENLDMVIDNPEHETNYEKYKLEES